MIFTLDRGLPWQRQGQTKRETLVTKMLVDDPATYFWLEPLLLALLVAVIMHVECIVIYRQGLAATSRCIAKAVSGGSSVSVDSRSVYLYRGTR